MASTTIEDIKPVLQKFDAFSLEELDAANLIERRDIKYIFPVNRSLELIEKLIGHYRILEVKNHRYTDYETVYYDTKGFKFYFQHHNENLNRQKVRVRKYVQSDLIFSELKSKNNKGWVSKERSPTDSLFMATEGVLQEIGEALEAKLKIDYTRITFLSMDGSEKLTLDFNMKVNHFCPTVHFNNLVIAELKSKDHTKNYFGGLIKDMRLASTGISKYCLGIAYAYPAIKQNNFKEKLYKLKKLENI